MPPTPTPATEACPSADAFAPAKASPPSAAPRSSATSADAGLKVAGGDEWVEDFTSLEQFFGEPLSGPLSERCEVAAAGPGLT
ncbi:hypothetical protein [Streptomyces sp. NPDC102360]|uniref:hypothetical protein n=1 Tax=Streptomyces sp. NPDC102360 TaxID=3366160 RepID=UPI0037F128A9